MNIAVVPKQGVITSIALRGYTSIPGGFTPLGGYDVICTMMTGESFRFESATLDGIKLGLPITSELKVAAGADSLPPGSR